MGLGSQGGGTASAGGKAGGSDPTRKKTWAIIYCYYDSYYGLDQPAEPLGGQASLWVKSGQPDPYTPMYLGRAWVQGRGIVCDFRLVGAYPVFDSASPDGCCFAGCGRGRG